ncbi:MAG TPA: nuclear transport factor 2 family protein [Candidatus Baltobacteraceae bacterium]|nr:nuclear transport factor 2 family protein [Candidatus Baltobacteraceae bacterium]
MLTTLDFSPVRQFVTALERRDFETLQQALSDTVRFRALIPPGLREFEGAADSRAVIERWFGDADVFEMECSSIGSVGGRVQAHYRIRLRERGEWSACEQQLFADVELGKIVAIDLLCSGFVRL